MRPFIILQYLLPKHFLSRLVGFFAEGTLFKNFFIKVFIRRYKVDMSEALIQDINQFENFNGFFTRALKKNARKIENIPGVIVCPADGAVSQLGNIEDDKILQAKGHSYSLIELLGGDLDIAEKFRSGSFATIYLAPKDYHRVHMPLAGTLEKVIYIPGKLFSVNQLTAEYISNLFARNERAVCYFSSDAGPMALILVGAMIVAGIETVWSGQICPSREPHKVQSTNFENRSPAIKLATGSEMGRFKLGSTAIVLFGPGAVTLDQNLSVSSRVKMGQKLGQLNATL